jgi:hypothetical protein
MSFTVSDLQTQVAYKLNETSVPISTSDDYVQRLAFANEAVRHWTLRADWNILKTYNTSLTTTASQNYVNLPSNFVENSLSGKVYVTSSTGDDTEFTVVAYEDKNATTVGNRCWTSFDITTSTWRLYFLVTPTENLTVKIQYKINHPVLTDSTSVLLPSNPDWTVNYVAARVRESRDENAVSQSLDSLNEQLMQLMIQADLKDNLNTTKKVRTPFDRVGRGYGI